jgi:hypothetical protein
MPFFSLALPFAQAFQKKKSFIRASPSLPSCCSFHWGGMSRIDDAYSIRVLSSWRYLHVSDISFLFYNKLYLYIYETTDDHDDHGIQTHIVSSVLFRVGQFNFYLFSSVLFRVGQFNFYLFSSTSSNLAYITYQCPAHWRQTYFRPKSVL